MFETLQDRLSGIFDKLTGRGALSEADVDTAMREVRRALIEADVALEVVRKFVEDVKEKAVGRESDQVGDARPDGRQDRQ
jgi:signal recognition particle subunit SRP54